MTPRLDKVFEVSETKMIIWHKAKAAMGLAPSNFDGTHADFLTALLEFSSISPYFASSNHVFMVLLVLSDNNNCTMQRH